MQDFIAARKALRYLKGANFSFTYSRPHNCLDNFAFNDADCAGDVKTRKTVSGMVIKLNESDSPVLWRTAKPPSVSLSTCELGYMALSSLAKEVLLLKPVFQSANLNTTIPILFSDNQGAICVAHETSSRLRAKHIDMKNTSFGNNYAVVRRR